MLNRGNRALRKKLPGIIQSISFLGFYVGWSFIFRILILTLVTYFLMSKTTPLQDISEFFGTNEIMISSFSAFLFVLLLYFLFPLTRTKRQEIIQWKPLYRYFLPGFLNGSAISIGLLGAFLLGGYYEYWGIFIQSDSNLIASFNVFFRALALIVFVYCEEFLFRKKLIDALSKTFTPLICAFISAGSYCLVKSLQFELGAMHLITLFLVSLRLALLAVSGWSFTRGAGYWAALLVFFHPLLGLPIFGNEFNGVFYLKYLGAEGAQDAFLSQIIGENPDWRMALFLTGGIGGPLSSFALQAILIAQLMLSAVKEKKMIWIPKTSTIR